jgi:LPS-assembly protein
MRRTSDTEKRKVGRMLAGVFIVSRGCATLIHPETRGRVRQACATHRRRFARLTVTRFLRPWLALCVVAPLSLFSQTSAPETTARNLGTDPATGEIVLTGDARLSYRGALLEADEIRYQPDRQLATARGNARLTRGTQRLIADEITYRVSDRTFTATQLRLGDFPIYLSSRSAEGERDAITFTDATVTYHEPTRLEPVLHAEKITYRAGESISARHAWLGVGPVRPLWFRSYEQSLERTLFSVLDGHVGYDGNLGAYLGAGTLLPVTRQLQAGGDAIFYSKRGFLFGPTAVYAGGAGEQSYRGAVRTGYINDNGPRLLDIVANPIAERRGYFEWEHRQILGDSLTLNGQVGYWSDSAVIRDFRPELFYPVQQPDTFLEAAHTGTNIVVSLFARAQPNSYYRVQQRLPELRFDLLPSALAGDAGLYQQLQASAAVLREDALFAGDTLRSDRYDAYYALARPTAVRPWLDVTPVAGARVTHYARATGGQGDYTRVLGEIGADASLRASGTFNYRNERWGIDGLRHLATPRLSYRYIPEADKGRAYIPPIDERVFATYLQPLGLGEQRVIDDLRATNTLRLAFDNTVQTRDKTYGSRDLLRADFAADFLPNPKAGERDFSAVHAELAFTPVNWLSFNLYQSTTPQDFTLRELNTGFTLRDGDVWSLTLANHFLRRNIHEYIGYTTYRLNEAYQTYAHVRYDARVSRFTEQSVGLVQNLDNLWTIQYGVVVYDSPRREDSFGFSIRINLTGF